MIFRWDPKEMPKKNCATEQISDLLAFVKEYTTEPQHIIKYEVSIRYTALRSRAANFTIRFSIFFNSHLGHYN